MLGPGDSFPRLDLRDSRGEAVRIPDGEAGETLYVFFKTTCPTCELLWPYLDRLRRRVGDDLQIVGVSQDAPRETATFSRAAGADVPILFDPPPWHASEAVGLENVPTMFLVSENGRIRETILGFQKSKLEDLAASDDPFFRPDEKVPEVRPG